MKYQANASCVIMSVILMTTLYYKALILQGEIWCWSLLGLKGLMYGVVRKFSNLSPKRYTKQSVSCQEVNRTTFRCTYVYKGAISMMASFYCYY